MKIQQLYTGCLAQGAYYIESNGEAAIIDPLREVNSYIDRANLDNAQIKYVFETHFHADFVSGHLTLSEKTGAPIVYGPNAKPSFEAHIAEDGEVFKLGNATITALHTPGHTLESTTFLLKDENGKAKAIFSGDTLFLGDVGRPDLAQKGKELTQEDLAGMLYDSLRNKILPLPDDITVYPAHGAGSACGKNMMSETMDTLGNQKDMNYALRADMTKEEFIKEVTDGLLPPPAYFPLNVKLNKEGYESIDAILEKGTRKLNPDEFEAIANETGALVLDVRFKDDFSNGLIPRSVFIGIDGSFAPWVGALIKDVAQPILLVAEKGKEEEAITRLARVGFDNTLGYLEGGFEAWKAAGKEIDQVNSISPEELKAKLEEGITVVDVRKVSEYNDGHLEEALNIPLGDLNEKLSEIPEQEFYMHCKSGYRSVIAASILKARGIHNVIDVKEGFQGLEAAQIPMLTRA